MNHKLWSVPTVTSKGMFIRYFMKNNVCMRINYERDYILDHNGTFGPNFWYITELLLGPAY